MLNRSVTNIDTKQSKDKRFVRSRSGGQNNLPESPRMHFSSGMGQQFFNKFISQGSKNVLKDKENMVDQSLRDPCTNKLGEKLKCIQLEEELKKCRGEKDRYKDEVEKLKELLAGNQGGTNRKKGSKIEEKTTNEKQNKGNAGLKKLKQKIAETRGVDPIATAQKSQKTSQENKQLKIENSQLKVTITQLQSILAEMKTKLAPNNRQQALQDTICKLQGQVRHLEEDNRKLDMMLKINLAKSVNFEQNRDNTLKEQLQSLKMKHNKLICQYNTLRKQTKNINATDPLPKKQNSLIYLSRVEAYERSLSLTPETEQKRL